jgi:hypothetical protein
MSLTHIHQTALVVSLLKDSTNGATAAQPTAGIYGPVWTAVGSSESPRNQKRATSTVKILLFLRWAAGRRAFSRPLFL